MKKILKGTILLFIFALVVCTCRTEAIRNIGISVTVPALKGKVNAEHGIIKEKDGQQYFTTSTSKYTNSDSNALVEVQTYNQTVKKYSDFIHAPVRREVAIPNGYNITLGESYSLIARNTDLQVNTVNFGGVWTIDK